MDNGCLPEASYACEIQVLDDGAEESKGSPQHKPVFSPDKRNNVQRVLEDFGFGDKKQRGQDDQDEDGEGGLGSG